MIISSELTGKRYDTVEECLSAEKKFKEEEEKRIKEKQEKQQMLDEAFEEAVEAWCRYLELAGVKIVEIETDEEEEEEDSIEFLSMDKLLKIIFG